MVHLVVNNYGIDIKLLVHNQESCILLVRDQSISVRWPDSIALRDRLRD